MLERIEKLQGCQKCLVAKRDRQKGRGLMSCLPLGSLINSLVYVAFTDRERYLNYDYYLFVVDSL